MISKESKKQIMSLVEEYNFEIFVSCRIPRSYEMNVEGVNSYNSQKRGFDLKASGGYSLYSDDYDFDFEDVDEVEFDYSGTYNGVSYDNTGLSEDQLFEELSNIFFEELSNIFKELNVKKVAQLSDAELLREYESQAMNMGILKAEMIKRENDPTKTKVPTIHSARDYLSKKYELVDCEELHVISFNRMDYVINDDCVSIKENEKVARVAEKVAKIARLNHADYVHVVNIQKTASLKSLKRNVEIADTIYERLDKMDRRMRDYALMVRGEYLSYILKSNCDGVITGLDDAINEEEKNENSRYR